MLPAGTGLPAGGAALTRLPELPSTALNVAPTAIAVLQAAPSAFAAPAVPGGQVPASLLGPAVAKDVKV